MKKKFIPGKTRVLYGGGIFGSREKAALNKAIKKGLEEGSLGIAEEAAAFEKEIASSQKIKKAVFLNSGTSALDAGFRALHLPAGSEVIVPACTFPTPIASLINLGLIPVVADIDPESYFIDAKSVEKLITRKTKAILVVYVAGSVGDLEAILRIAKKHKLLLVEDNCDGFGGLWDGKALGSFGIFSAISTHVAHMITTFGEGGLFFSNDEELADKVRSIRDWGRDKAAVGQSKIKEDGIYGLPWDLRRFVYTELGYNYKPLELQAAVGRIQLKRLADFKKKRAENFNTLNNILAGFKSKITLPRSHPKADPSWYTFPITLNGVPRARVLAALDKANIEWRPVLAGSIARQPAFKDRVVVRAKTPNADRLIRDSFWVPVHPRHTTVVMEFIGKTIVNAL